MEATDIDGAVDGKKDEEGAGEVDVRLPCNRPHRSLSGFDRLVFRQFHLWVFFFGVFHLLLNQVLLAVILLLAMTLIAVMNIAALGL